MSEPFNFICSMSYIDATLVEFERKDIENVPTELLLRQKAKLSSFYYELYDSYLRGGKYIVRYMFYTLKAARRLTAGQLRKQFAALSPQIGTVMPEEQGPAAEEAAGKEIILYTYGAADEEKLCAYLKENRLAAPAVRFAESETSPQLEELKKATFYTFRKDAFLLLSHDSRLLENPLFYTVLEEYQIPLRSVDFPWLCRKNLRLMQAMTLYRMVK